MIRKGARGRRESVGNGGAGTKKNNNNNNNNNQSTYMLRTVSTVHR